MRIHRAGGRCGLAPGQIRHRFRTGQWERVGHSTGVPGNGCGDDLGAAADRRPARPGRRRRRFMRAAAALHGFEGFPPRPVEFTIPRRTGGARSMWQVHTTSRCELIDRASVGGFPCTSAARTIVDLAAVVTEQQLSRAIDTAVREGLSSPTFMRKRLTSLDDGAGSGRVVRLLDELMVATGGESDLERHFRGWVRRTRRAAPTRLPADDPHQGFDDRQGGLPVPGHEGGGRGQWSARPMPLDPSGRDGSGRGPGRNELQTAGFVAHPSSRTTRCAALRRSSCEGVTAWHPGRIGSPRPRAFMAPIPATYARSDAMNGLGGCASLAAPLPAAGAGRVTSGWRLRPWRRRGRSWGRRCGP